MPRKKRGSRKGPPRTPNKSSATASVPDSAPLDDNQSEPEDNTEMVEQEDVDLPQQDEQGESSAVLDQASETVGTNGSTAVSIPSTSSASGGGGGGKICNEQFWKPLKTDKQYLADVSLGYKVAENLNDPLKCFTSEDENQLFPVIETISSKLFVMVQKMNNHQKKEIKRAIKSKKGVLRFPCNGIKAFLCHIDSMEPPKTESTSPKRTPHPFLLTEDENAFSEEKLKQLRAVLDAGWKREVVMRSQAATGRKTGDVYYYSPDGTKFRSSKQVALHLQQLENSPFTMDNFSFAKARISTNPDQEIVRKAYDGQPSPRGSPVKAKAVKRAAPPAKIDSKPGPKPSSSGSPKDSTEVDTRGEEIVKGVSSRRSIQPPKRYSGDAVLLLSKRPKIQDDKQRNSNSNKGLMQMGMLPPKYPKGMEDSLNAVPDVMDYADMGMDMDEAPGHSVAMKEIADDSLFAISALRQSGGIDVDKMHQYVENQKKMGMKPGAAHGVGAKPKGSRTTVIPCSIRCPGMTGVIPNLQCTRCLCLFHAECLGLPPNLMFNKYLCSNCTEQGPTPSAAGAANPVPQKVIMKKPQNDMKRGPPGLSPLQHPRAVVPGRDITVTLAGRERLPARLPQKVPTVQLGQIIRPKGKVMIPSIRPQHQRLPDGSTVTMRSGNMHLMRRAMPSTVNRTPQLNKNLTITQLPRMPGPPRLPTLQPMMTAKALPGKLPLPPMAGAKPRQPMPTVPNLMKTDAFRVTVPRPSLSTRPFKKVTPAAAPPQAPVRLRLTQQSPVHVLNRTPTNVYTTVADRSIPMVKRAPQSVCMIGNKKYVVLPRKVRELPPGIAAPMGNGGIAKNYPISEEATTANDVNQVSNDVDVPVNDSLQDCPSENAGIGDEVAEDNIKESSVSEQMLSNSDEASEATQQENGSINELNATTLTAVVSSE